MANKIVFEATRKLVVIISFSLELLDAQRRLPKLWDGFCNEIMNDLFEVETIFNGFRELML